MNQIIHYLFSIVAALIALTVHEYCHGYAAYKLGDDTARNLGRLSLNPIKHLDIVGAICMVLFHFGWAKPVPINARNFNKPKRDFAICAVAGPLSNVILAFFTAPIVMLIARFIDTQAITPEAGYWFRVCYYAYLFFYYFLVINIGLGIFNLIPIPPFDGSRILNVILPTRVYFRIMKYERYIYWGVIAWLFIGEYVYLALISINFISASPILSSICKIFSLSGILNNAIDGILSVFTQFWGLFIK